MSFPFHFLLIYISLSRFHLCLTATVWPQQCHCPSCCRDLASSTHRPIALPTLGATHLHGPRHAQGSWQAPLATEHPMGPQSPPQGAWELRRGRTQDKSRAKCLIGKIVAQQVSAEHNSINGRGKCAIWIMTAPLYGLRQNTTESSQNQITV